MRHPTEEHLCADLAKRYERQAKAVDLVAGALHDIEQQRFSTPQAPLAWTDCIDADEHREEALSVIKALAGRDLGA